jgi:hypothetical protein
LPGITSPASAGPPANASTHHTDLHVAHLPTYHFGQLVWNQLGPASDVRDFGSPAPDSLLLHLAWVVGCFIFFAVLAAIGYRRDLERDHG